MENNTRATRSDAEEYNDLSSAASAPARERKAPPKRPVAAPQGKKGGKTVNKKLIIGIIIAVVVLLLAAGIVALVLTAERHITKKDNAFLVYTDSNGTDHLISNGTEIDKKFEGDVEIEIAADNSFAYVLDKSTEGIYVYVLEGKKLKPLTSSAVEDVLCLASLKPGMVYVDNAKYRTYSEKYGEEIITKNQSADDFTISADGSTVAYTVSKSSSADVRELTLFKDGSNTTLNAANNCTPVAVSNYGDYVYASFATNDTQKLCIFTTKDLEDPEGQPIAESEGFYGILSMNAKGDEILFLTLSTEEGKEEFSTRLYRYAKKGDQISSFVTKAVMMPMASDPDIVFFDDFADVYLTAFRPNDTTQRAIYYLDKNYDHTRITSYTLAEDATKDSCTIDPDGKYLYYINEKAELIQLDLTSDVYEDDAIAYDIKEFYITQKGNIYYRDDEDKLRYREAGQRKTITVADEVNDTSFYRYSNTIFFTTEEGDSILSSKEGSEKKTVKMDGAQVTSLPEFYNPNSKKSYAAYYDIDNGGLLYYTANGKSFKKITNDCQAINDDVLSDNVG